MLGDCPKGNALEDRTSSLSTRRSPGRDTLFALLVTAVYLLYAGFTTYHHEMWRDEMGPWLIARDSGTLLDVFHNIRYDGHPSLWYLLLWPLTRLFSDPQAMQWLNLAICAGAVFLIAWAAPAPRWLRAAAALSYYPIFEYGSVARNYSLGLFALVAFCTVFPKRRERPLLLGALLLLAANTSMLACLIAMTATFMLGLEALVGKGDTSVSGARWAGLGIAAAGICFSIYLIIPPPDTGYAMGWHFDLDPARVLLVLKNMTAAYLPLPRPGAGFWETQLLAGLPAYRDFSWLAAPLILGTVSLSLLRRPLALVYYLAGSLGLLAFFYVKHVGYLRHHGFLFVCLATALWIAATLEPVALPEGLDAAVRRLEKGVAVFFSALLTLHLAGALIAASGEYRYSFSAAKETAELIRSRGLERLPLIADLDVTGMAVVGYLNKPAAYYPCGDRFGSYVIWDTARMQHSIVWEQAPILAAKSGSAVVVLVDDFVLKKFPIPAELQPRLQLVGCQKAGVATEESYCVYLLAPAAPPAKGKAE